MIETESPTLINTYEKSIHKLEKEKILLGEKAKKSKKTQPNFERAFRTTLVWLANPVQLWDTGCLADRKSLLKILLTDNLLYDKNEVFLNRPIAQPVRLCGQYMGSNNEVVDRASLSSNLKGHDFNKLFDTLMQWKSILEPD